MLIELGSAGDLGDLIDYIFRNSSEPHLHAALTMCPEELKNLCLRVSGLQTAIRGAQIIKMAEFGELKLPE